MLSFSTALTNPFPPRPGLFFFSSLFPFPSKHHHD
jgi:hypothetical protein